MKKRRRMRKNRMRQMKKRKKIWMQMMKTKRVHGTKMI